MRKPKYVVQRLKIPKNATEAEIYAILRKSFSIADLQTLLDPEPTVPGEQLLAELVAIHREETRKRRKK